MNTNDENEELQREDEIYGSGNIEEESDTGTSAETADLSASEADKNDGGGEADEYGDGKDHVTEEESESEDSGLNYEPIIGSYKRDDIFEQLIGEVRRRSEKKSKLFSGKDAKEDEEDEIFGEGGGSDGSDDDVDDDAYAEENFGETESVSEPDISVSVNGSVKGKKPGLADKLKQSELLDPVVIKDMFFGSSRADGEHDIKFTPDEAVSAETAEEAAEEEAIEQSVVFDRRRKRRTAADPNQDKVIFSIEYMLTPDQALDGYMLFYNQFVKKKNIKITLVLGLIALVFFFSVIVSPKGYLNYLLLLITLSIIAMRWINSEGAKRDAVISADEVKNDSYRLDFYNSRILLKASELTGDKIYNYPPVMIRFEDIDLKVLDYEELYVLIFKNSYVYTVPKSAMTDEQNRVFGGLLESILGDDYCEFYSRARAAEERAERRRSKRREKAAAYAENKSADDHDDDFDNDNDDQNDGVSSGTDDDADKDD